MGEYIEDFFEKFFEHKDDLNRQFHQGDISKKEYIEENYYKLMEMGQKPYKYVDNVFKALYNYQYYNMTGKFYKLRLKEFEKYNKHPEKEREYYKKIQDCYYRKDQSTLKLLDLLDYYDVEGYYISVKSKDLKNKLFEIVVESHEINAVLHSVNPMIVEKMKENGVFSTKSKKSVIESYINSRY